MKRSEFTRRERTILEYVLGQFRERPYVLKHVTPREILILADKVVCLVNPPTKGVRHGNVKKKVPRRT